MHLVRSRKIRGFAHLKTAVLLSLLGLVTIGCAGQPTQFGTFVRTVPSEQAMVLPPPGGPAVVSVVERRYDNAVEQDVYLSTSARTPGQNVLKAQFFGTVSPFKLSDNKLTSIPVTQSGIASEMRRALPGIRMARSSFYVQNGYGPFGYAFGRGIGNDLCMYAWQQIRSPSGTISPLANYGSIQVRLRLCQANATEERLLSVMYNYSITGSVDAGGWNPFGEPQSVPSTLGGNGAPIYPRPRSSEPIVPVLRTQPAVVVVRSKPAVQAAPPVAQTGTPRSPAVSVPRPAAPQPSQNENSRLSAPQVSPTLSVPSPSDVMGARQVTVPSPSCADATSGSAHACR